MIVPHQQPVAAVALATSTQVTTIRHADIRPCDHGGQQAHNGPDHGVSRPAFGDRSPAAAHRIDNKSPMTTSGVFPLTPSAGFMGCAPGADSDR
jgi:hypothetical protein